MANILVYALHYDGAINKNSLGAFGPEHLGGTVVADRLAEVV